MEMIIFRCLISIGIVIMITNVARYYFFARRVQDLIPASDVKMRLMKWTAFFLLVFFLVAYIIVVVVTRTRGNMVVAGILFGGSIFVSIILTVLISMVDMLRFQLFFDESTGLLNRKSLNETEVNKKIKTVAVIDIDDFKFINEKYGHMCGDAILRELGARLRQHEEYHAIRMGADEFMLRLEEDIRGRMDLDREIRQILTSPVAYEGDWIPFTCSAGCAVKKDRESFEELVNNADLALYHARDQGGHQVFAIFTEELKQEVAGRRKLIADLEEAISEKSFEVLYQPQILSESGEVCGFEALCRFKDNRYYPNQFIPVAESNGMIMAIDRIVTEKVIRQMKAWKDQDLELPVLSINYSAAQLQDEGYLDFLKDLLLENGIGLDRIKIEITESFYMGANDLSRRFFAQIQRDGVALALDDFGAGYSSLGAITEFPVTYVKFDKSIVDAYLQEGKESYISHLVAFIHDLGKEIVAEGVETKLQYEMAKRLHIDQIQGYYFSKPLPAWEAIRYRVDESRED